MRVSRGYSSNHRGGPRGASSNQDNQSRGNSSNHRGGPRGDSSYQGNTYQSRGNSNNLRSYKNRVRGRGRGRGRSNRPYRNKSQELCLF